MGTPPACMWATLYFSIWEDILSAEFSASNDLLFWARYIDDGIGIWNWTGTRECVNNWKVFKEEMQSYGKLRWEFSEPSTKIVMLDTTLTINNGKVDSCLYEKQLNLYLYLPPHSCHSPGVLKGLIAGMLYRILRLTTNKTLRQQQAQRLYNRLIARGYLPQMIMPIFNTYIKKYFRKKPLLDN